MRVTAKAKEQTRGRILKVASNLFQEKGFEETTTRDIAAGAKIATGTLFNYFPSKEALALALVSQCFAEAREDFRAHLRGDESVDERLFAHIATSLRHLKSHRGYLVGLLESSLRPSPNSTAHEEGGAVVRRQHMEVVREILATNDAADGPEPDAVTLHLYWTLFLGVVSYWVADQSPQQEDTLVLLDQSMRLFVNSLSTNYAPGTEGGNGT